MEILIMLLVAVLVFALFWHLIGMIGTLPAGSRAAPPAWLSTVLYIILIVIAIIWLVQRFMGGALF